MSNDGDFVTHQIASTQMRRLYKFDLKIQFASTSLQIKTLSLPKKFLFAAVVHSCIAHAQDFFQTKLSYGFVDVLVSSCKVILPT